MDTKEKLAKLLKAKLTCTSPLGELGSWITESYGSDLHVTKVTGRTLSWMVVTEKTITHVTPSDAQLQICSNNTYQLKVLGF